MTECFCKNKLLEKKGKSKICVQMEDSIAIVEIENATFCLKCNSYFLTTKQLISAFTQIKEATEKGQQSIEVGIYN